MDFSFPFGRRQNFGYGLLLLLLAGGAIAKSLLPSQQTTSSETLSFAHFPIFSAAYEPPCLEINQASIASWDSLPGIGPKLSKRIVRYRDSRGGFRNTQEIAAVYGLPPETLDRIEDQLWLEKPARLRQKSKRMKKSVLRSSPYHRTKYRSRSTQLTQIVDLN
ncbi:MAG: helix-hairpin-helix domain-containing protein, partial [Bacteroidota bacterium]